MGAQRGAREQHREGLAGHRHRRPRDREGDLGAGGGQQCGGEHERTVARDGARQRIGEDDGAAYGDGHRHCGTSVGDPGGGRGGTL